MASRGMGVASGGWVWCARRLRFATTRMTRNDDVVRFVVVFACASCKLIGTACALRLGCMWEMRVSAFCSWGVLTSLHGSASVYDPYFKRSLPKRSQIAVKVLQSRTRIFQQVNCQAAVLPQWLCLPSETLRSSKHLHAHGNFSMHLSLNVGSWRYHQFYGGDLRVALM